MLLSSSNWKCQPYPLLSYFSAVMCLRCLLHHIFCHLLHIHSGKTGILFSLLLRNLWLVQIVGYVLPSRACSFVRTLHHRIIIIFSQFSVIQYMGLCVFSLPISFVMIERIGSMNYYTLFRVRSWNNGMRCMSLYILTLWKSFCLF